jgi:hypothetical protein
MFKLREKIASNFKGKVATRPTQEHLRTFQHDSRMGGSFPFLFFLDHEKKHDTHVCVLLETQPPWVTRIRIHQQGAINV